MRDFGSEAMAKTRQGEADACYSFARAHLDQLDYERAITYQKKGAKYSKEAREYMHIK